MRLNSHNEDYILEDRYRRLVEDHVEFNDGDCSLIDYERVAKGWNSNLPVERCGEYELKMQREAKRLHVA